MRLLSARRIWKSLGRRIVLRGVDLEVDASERVVVLGSNGSGKSTLLATVAGVFAVDEGEIDLAMAVGYAPERPDLPDHLLVEEWLALVASLRDSPVTIDDAPFGVGALRSKRLASLSLGQGQRVSLAAALLGSPSLLVLDEPTNALDQEAHGELIARLKELAPTRAALIATHDHDFAREIGTRVLVMEGGVCRANRTATDPIDTQITPK